MKLSAKSLSTLTAIFLLVFNIPAQESDTTMSSLFEMSIEELVEQQVTIATKSIQEIDKSPSVVSVITAEEIKEMGYRDLEEALQSLPGYEVTQVRVGSKSFGIRGVSNVRQGGRLLILLDGTPYNGVMYGSGVHFGASYNLDEVKRIEVIRGPGSALYGRNAFSGVVNIITKKSLANKEVEANFALGSFNTKEAHLAAGMSKGDFNARIGGKFLSTDATDSKFDNGFGGESLYNVDHENYYLNANAEYKNLQFFGSYSNRTDGMSSGPFMTDGNSVFRIFTYNLSYNFQVKEKTDLSIKFSGRNEHRIQNVEIYKPGLISSHPNGVYAKPVFDGYNYSLEFEGKRKMFDNNQFLLGIKFDMLGINDALVSSNYDLMTFAPITYTDGQGNEVQYSKHNMPRYEPGWIVDNGHGYYNAAIYLQDEHVFAEKLFLTLGGRLDMDSEAGLIFNPRLAFVYVPNNWSSIRFLYGEAYRAPTTNEQYKIMGFERGNADLKYEEIKTTEISYSVRHKRLFSQVAFYYNLLDNVILIQTIDTNGVKKYFNNGENRSYGMELEARYKFSNNIQAFSNYSYVISEDNLKNDSEKIKSDHPNLAKHKFNLGFNSKFNKLNFSLWMRYHGELTKFSQNMAADDSDYVSQDNVGDYYMLNSSIRLLDILPGFDISLYGYNLLNEEYYFQDDQYSHQPAQPKINFLAKISYRFN